MPFSEKNIENKKKMKIDATLGRRKNGKNTNMKDKLKEAEEEKIIKKRTAKNENKIESNAKKITVKKRKKPKHENNLERNAKKEERKLVKMEKKKCAPFSLLPEKTHKTHEHEQKHGSRFKIGKKRRKTLK